MTKNGGQRRICCSNYSDIHLTAHQRDNIISELRKRGYSLRCIGRHVGMDASSVLRALRRLEAGGPGTKDPRP